MPTLRANLLSMSDVIQEIAELLEDFAAVGEEVWESARLQAAQFIADGVSEARFNDFGQLEQHRDTLTRHIVVSQVTDFLQREGFSEEDIGRVMRANGHGFSEADLLNLEDGITPDAEAIEAYRVRALCAHYALVGDSDAAQIGLIQGG